MARADVDFNGKLDPTEFVVMMHNNQEDLRNIEADELQRRQEMLTAFRLVGDNQCSSLNLILQYYRAFDQQGAGKIPIKDVMLFLRHFGEDFTAKDFGDIVKTFDFPLFSSKILI